ncbi:MAG: gliding motility-associated C-terminal domain-containing protein [Bacteroidia bacterium]|nr:gliding motility-associated C-terminal domain-containing protein [Bacteroidia bacterium]
MKLSYHLTLSLFLFFSLAFGTEALRAQQNLLVINSSVGTNLTVCLNQIPFQLQVENPSPFNILNDTVTMTLPTGVYYQPGSIAGGIEVDISDLQNPVFRIPDMNSLSSHNFSVTLEAGCGIRDFLSSGGQLVNTVLFEFDASNGIGVATPGSQTLNSAVYSVSIPSLALTTVTNQSYNASVGDVFTRCITIVNGGNGALDEFYFKDEHGVGISINAVSAGTLTPVPNGLLIHFTAADFMTVGDGDGLFEPGENITFCETVQVVACADVSSDFYYYWGCGQDTCEIQTDGANVNFPGEVPDLTFTPFNSFTGSVLNANCYGNNAMGDFESGFDITNAGTGTAYNVDIELYQHANGGNYTSDYYSSLNTGSFTYQLNGGPVLPLTLTATSNSVARPCLPPNPKGRVYFTIDSILPGDVVTIRWNHFTCCYNNLCTNTERKHMLGWQFRGTYENRCYTPYTIPLVSSPAGVSYFRNTLIVDNSPGTMTGSSTETISFLFSNFETVLPRNTANDLFYYEVALPPCLTVVPGSFRILNAAGNQLANPDSMVTNGNLVRFYYSGPVGGVQAQLLFDISLDCSSCASTGVQNISLSSVYIPDRTCGCAINLGCVTTSIEILCPALCEGANLTTVNCQRVNYGLPDNDNNGLPDPGGAIDFNKVKTTRLMYGDTLGVEQVAYIHDPNGQNWGHIIAVSNIEGTGNIFTYGSGTLRIYDAATGNYYSCNAPSALTTTNIPGGVRYAHDINVAALAGGCLPAGYTLKTGDSVFWKMNYVVTSNIGGASVNGNSVNYMYASAVPYVQPVDSNDLHGCNKVVRTFTVIGYYYTNYGPDSYDINNCNQFTISQNYYLSIGICCNNYGGGNLFPFEYRHWASPRMLRVVMPDDYTYIRARFNFVRTAGTLVTSTSPWFNINPSAVVGNTYDFDVSGYFGSTAADSILFGDDGFHGTLQVTFEPNCNVADSTGYIGYYWTFDESAQLQPSPTSPTSNVLTNDDVTYNSPLVSLQSNLLSINTSTGNVNWTLTMTNQSNVSTGSNLWIGYSSNGNIVADSILVNGTGQMLYPGPGNIFNLQQIGPAVTNTYTLYTHSTSCTTDSIMIYFGWGCSGIPTNLASYECAVTPLKLTITPLFPALENSISILTADTIPLCDTTEYEILVRDFQLGNAYNILTQILLPNGLTLVPGSSQFQYNGAFVSVPDPVLLGGTTWQWSINGMSQVLAGNGLAGIYDPQSNSFWIRFRAFATCNFISGERVRVQSTGEAFCGLGVSSIPVFSAPLLVQDALPPYQADIKLKMDFITPCTGGSQLLIRVLNLGTQPFDMFDSLRLSLTNGLNFIPGSQVPIHNAPAGAPLITSPNGFQELIWHLPQGVVPGDSSVFSVMLDADPSLLECGIVQISASSTASGFASCSQNGASCNISVVTGDTLRNIFIYKGYLQLSNGSGVSVPAPPAGESATVSFDIFNSGETIIAGTNTVISYYGDADGNGIFSAGDVPIGVHTITDQLGSNSTFNYTHTLPVNSPYTCGIIAVVDTSANPCICATQQVYIPIQLHSPPLQYQVCSGNTINIGNPAINNYTYNWNNAGYLDSATAAQPDFLHNTAYPVTDTIVFVRQIQKPGCAASDTVTVIVFPEPVPQAGADISLCNSYNTLLPAIAPQGTATGVWTLDGNFANPSGVNFADSTLFNTDAGGLQEGSYQLIWTLSSGPCAPRSDTMQIFVYDQPVSNAGADIPLCNIYNTLLAGNAPQGTATGVWTLDGGFANPSGVSFSDSTLFNADASGLQEGTYQLIWTLSNGTCVPSSDTMQVMVYDQPVSNAGADISLCNIYNTLLAGNAPVGTAMGLWTLDGAFANPSGVTFSDDTLFNTDASGLQEGTYQLIWTLSNGTCVPSSDTMRVFVYDQPVSNAGPDIFLCDSPLATLAGNMPPGTAQGSWSVISGPGTPVFADINLYNTGVSALVPGNYAYVWTLTNGTCPPAADTMILYNQPLPDAISSYVTEICDEQCMKLSSLSTAPPNETLTAWEWYIDGNMVSDDQTFEYCFTQEGVYSVLLVTQASNGCRDSSDFNPPVTVRPLPQAGFSTKPAGSAPVMEPVHIYDESSPDVISYLYTSGNGNSSSAPSPQFFYTSFGTYYITQWVTNSYTCRDSLTKPIDIREVSNAYIPNAFTPGSNGINDEWRPVISNVTTYSLYIFDRWGELIFVSNDPYKGWNGGFRNDVSNPVQMGMYVYKVEYIDFDGKEKSLYGHINLLR